MILLVSFYMQVYWQIARWLIVEYSDTYYATSMSSSAMIKYSTRDITNSLFDRFCRLHCMGSTPSPLYSVAKMASSPTDIGQCRYYEVWGRTHSTQSRLARGPESVVNSPAGYGSEPQPQTLIGVLHSSFRVPVEYKKTVLTCFSINFRDRNSKLLV